MDFIVAFFTELDPTTIAQGGSIGAILLRIFASKKLRSMTLLLLLKFMRALMGRTKIEHHLFEERKTTEFLVENVELSTNLKTEIFRIIMNAKAKVMINYSEFWVNKYNKTFNKLDRFDLKKRMELLVKYMEYGKRGSNFRGYEFEIREALILKYGLEKGIKYFNYVYMDHFKEYQTAHNSIIKSFFDNIFLYQKSTNTELVREFLNRIAFSLTMTIDNLKFTFDEINGGLGKI